jgi:uncharacterized membrane protein
MRARERERESEREIQRESKREDRGFYLKRGKFVCYSSYVHFAVFILATFETLTPSFLTHSFPPSSSSSHPQFCCAQFVDVYNASAVVLATAPIAADLNISTGEGVWTLSAYVLVFAGFMLPVSSGWQR